MGIGGMRSGQTSPRRVWGVVCDNPTTLALRDSSPTPEVRVCPRNVPGYTPNRPHSREPPRSWHSGVPTARFIHGRAKRANRDPGGARPPLDRDFRRGRQFGEKTRRMVDGTPRGRWRPRPSSSALACGTIDDLGTAGATVSRRSGLESARLAARNTQRRGLWAWHRPTIWYSTDDSWRPA